MEMEMEMEMGIEIVVEIEGGDGVETYSMIVDVVLKRVDLEMAALEIAMTTSKCDNSF